MTKVPRDGTKWAAINADDGTFELVVSDGRVSLRRKGTWVDIPRATFNEFVDWYIGTPQIRARLKALEGALEPFAKAGAEIEWRGSGYSMTVPAPMDFERAAALLRTTSKTLRGTDNAAAEYPKETR